MTDEQLVARIRETRPLFEARVAAGEVKVRGTLTYGQKGPSIRPMPGAAPPARGEG